MFYDISGAIENNLFTRFRSILEAKFGDESNITTWIVFHFVWFQTL